MEDENTTTENNHDKNRKSLKPRWWKPLWIITVIGMLATGTFSYFFFHTDLLLLIIIEIVLFIALGVGYYIRIKPNKNVNKAIYILLGVTPIGFGLCLLYGLTGMSRFLISLGSGWIYLNMAIFIILLVIGGFIGNWIGKKRNYRLPLSLNRE